MGVQAERRADPRRPSALASARSPKRGRERQPDVALRRRADRDNPDDWRTARLPISDDAPVVIAIEIGEPQLADRLSALLAELPGLRLAAPGEPADAALVDWGHPSRALTPRELDVLALMAEGSSNKAIARRLAISVHRVKFHNASLLDKLDAQGRAEAGAQGARLGAIRL